MNSIHPDRPFNSSSTDRVHLSNETPPSPSVEKHVIEGHPHSPILIEEDPIIKERYAHLRKELSTTLLKTSFTERESKKVQHSLKEIKDLQSQLNPASTQSLNALIETLSAAYSNATGENLADQDFYISPEEFERVAKTAVMLDNQYQATTVNQEAQKCTGEEEVNALQNQIENTQGMIDELNAQILKLSTLWGTEGGGDIADEINKLRAEIESLKLHNQTLADQIKTAQANIKTEEKIAADLEKINQILNTTPLPAADTPAFAALFNDAIQSRDSLQALLNSLDKSDPNYDHIDTLLKDLLVAYPFEIYPAGTSVTCYDRNIYTKKPNFDALIADSMLKEFLTPAFIDNFIKFINGDPNATYPMLNGEPMSDGMILLTKNQYFIITPTADTTVITKPDGGTIPPADAFSATQGLQGQATLNANLKQTIQAIESLISTNQSLITQNQATISTNQQQMSANEQSLNAIFAAQAAHLQEEINQNKDLKEVIDRLNGILNSDPDGSTTFSMSKLIATLIDLCQVLQKMATAVTSHLSIVTKKMSAYSKQLLEVPLLSKEDTEHYQKYNPFFTNAQEGIRINKTTEEDLAKQIQTILQSLKDASQAIEDFVGTILNMMASISQKISR